jgi:hypothetical protein
MVISNKVLSIFFLFLSFTEISAQFECHSGDCNNGTGSGIYNVAGYTSGKYEGSFKDGKFVIGTMDYVKGGRYEGEWNEYIAEGFGIKYNQDKSYDAGKWESGILIERLDYTKVKNILKSKKENAPFQCLRGECKNEYSEGVDKDGNVYKGNFLNGFFNGFGVMKFKNGDKYEGNWNNGKIHGTGTYYNVNGHTRSGNWENNFFTINQTSIYALIVGVADYKFFQKLTYTTSDAKKMSKHWSSPSGGLVPKDNIKLLLDEDATSENILNTMSDLFAKADTNDLIIFYFAGHGLEGMFLPVDYDNGNNILSHGSVINIMKDSHAKYKLILADACHSGSLGVKYEEYISNGNQFPLSATRGGKSIREQTIEFYKSFANVKAGLSIIMSSAPDEISLEANKLQQGVFSYFLIEGLKGKADSDKNKTITAKELFDFVSKNVDRYTHGFQTPNIGGGGEHIPIGVVFDEN